MSDKVPTVNNYTYGPYQEGEIYIQTDLNDRTHGRPQIEANGGMVYLTIGELEDLLVLARGDTAKRIVASTKQEALKAEGGASAYIMELKTKPTLKFLREYHVHNEPPSLELRNLRKFRDHVIDRVMNDGFPVPGTETNNGKCAFLKRSYVSSCFM